jgi:hypothetical protein
MEKGRVIKIIRIYNLIPFILKYPVQAVGAVFLLRGGLLSAYFLTNDIIKRHPNEKSGGSF